MVADEEPPLTNGQAIWDAIVAIWACNCVQKAKDQGKSGQQKRLRTVKTSKEVEPADDFDKLSFFNVLQFADFGPKLVIN
jgi:hypothetical protein